MQKNTRKIHGKELDSTVRCNVIMKTYRKTTEESYYAEDRGVCKSLQCRVQTLRYYDAIGILCADHVDVHTGYRYYHPDKVKIYQKIEHLKTLDFSLDEIRKFLGQPYAEQCRMYREKKQSLLDTIRKKQGQIRQLDLSCEEPENGGISLNEQILRIPFEDDPEVIGKWVYCGNRKPSEKFRGEEGLNCLPVLQKNLYFLPGGGHVWMYFWTKGTLYIVLNDFNVVVPNRYRVFSAEGRTYMEIDWLSGRFTGSLQKEPEDAVRVYRKENSHSYTERETRDFRDETALPYVPDPQVLGRWETVDVLKDPGKFSGDPERWYRKPFWIEGLVFYERGICSKILNVNGEGLERKFRCTAGVLIDEAEEHAEHYRIRTEGETDYLILEHKSGDYSYTGKVVCYYVFRRKDEKRTEGLHEE